MALCGPFDRVAGRTAFRQRDLVGPEKAFCQERPSEPLTAFRPDMVFRALYSLLDPYVVFQGRVTR